MTDDPYIWLEDKDGAAALAWVEAENARTLTRLETDPRYPVFRDEALAIASADDRIPMPGLLGGRVVNLWRDGAHPQGVWRMTSEKDFASAAPRWETLIDLDALSAAEGRQWVWKGAVPLAPDEGRCLVALSEGGEDAVRYREYDVAARAFVAGGFDLPIAKQTAAWLDRDTLLVARDWGEGTLTRSGYPFVLKLLRRGEPLDAASELFRGVPEDVAVSPAVLADGAGNRAVLVVRATTFFTSETWLYDGAAVQRLALPARSAVVGLVAGRLIVHVAERWATIPEGALASVALESATADPLTPTLIFAPGSRQAVDRDQVAVTRGAVVAAIHDNVRGRAMVFTPTGDGWTARPFALPDNLAVDLVATSVHSDSGYLAVSGFTTPTRLLHFDAAGAATREVKLSPARFDAAGLTVAQHEAVSADGTRVPYFIVRRADAPCDGTTPTLMTAYGGFAVPMTPYYSGIVGKLWLERGGAFVLANIRGGGEFGPAWHEAGRKTNRQRVFDDFAAVARDLFARGFTSAPRLGVYGGSNGGLLMGVMLTQYPELWGAVTIQVPLLDMVRYEQIAAGASWVDEYGSVAVPQERAFLERMSPYARLERGAPYPEPFIWTTTRDDRVGPQHARKFAARMSEYGLPYLFFEDTAGGHSGDADIVQAARLQALQMTYFAQKLMPRYGRDVPVPASSSESPPSTR